MSTKTLWSPEGGLPRARKCVCVWLWSCARGRARTCVRRAGARVECWSARSCARALAVSGASSARHALALDAPPAASSTTSGRRRAGHDWLQRGRRQVPRRRLLLRSPWTPQPRNLADFVAALDGQLHGVVQILSGATWGQPAAGAARIRAYAKCVRARARARGRTHARPPGGACST